MKRVTLAERGKRKRIKIQSHVLLILKFQVKGGNINVICDPYNFIVSQKISTVGVLSL